MYTDTNDPCSVKTGFKGIFVIHNTKKILELSIDNNLFCLTINKLFTTQSDSLPHTPPTTHYESLTTQSRGLKASNKRAFENIVGKGENAGNQHFLLFPQCFLPYHRPK